MSEVRDLKVALVLATSSGGVGRHVRSIAEGLVERGAKVVVCGPPATEETFDFSGTGARFMAVEISDRLRPVGDLKALGRLYAVVKDANVVHAHGLRAGALAALARLGTGRRGPAPVGVSVNGFAGPRLVVTLHNAVLAGGAIGAVYAVLERVVARGAVCVLGVSPDLEERMRALGARRVGHALVPSPPFADMPEQSVREELREELAAGERSLLLTVARLADQKGLPALLEAASALRKQQVLFVVAGDGPLDGALRDRIAADDLPVRLLGRRNDIPALLAASDLVVVPSVWEGQPLFVQEALHAGKPLIATRVGGIPDLVGAAALLVPANDAAALLGAISRVIEDPALALRLGAASAERAKALPSEDEAVGQLADLFRELSDS
jgi:glycosyltransferase involved in cell wall biosynthesis